jgi:hypothetical protein
MEEYFDSDKNQNFDYNCYIILTDTVLSSFVFVFVVYFIMYLICLGP